MKIGVLEWVKGPFANVEVEGFIVHETFGAYDIQISRILANKETEIPPRLKVGSIHNVPKRVIEQYFVAFTHEQQQSLIKLAVNLGQTEWAKELTEKFITARKLL